MTAPGRGSGADGPVAPARADPARADPTQLGPGGAAALVFGSSAAVLVVELVALRLLAPHYGLTLETSTLVIGLALTAIAVGSWAGGRAADHVSPRRLLGPLLAISGVAVAATPFLVRGAAATDDADILMVAATLTILVPGALLSAVTPVTIKLRLTSLDETGTVVGRLSAISTAGAIAGTVVTGFVLISRVPVTGILVGLGILLVAASFLVRAQRLGRGAAAAVVVLGLAGTAAVAVPGDCDVETTYHCLVVQTDHARESGRTLVLDGVRHSYVDLEDPRYLDFAYIQAMASVVDTAFPSGEPLAAYHLGAGGVTLPRYLDEVRPGTQSLVSEIDAGVVRVDTEQLGLELGDGIDVRVEDARLAVEGLGSQRFDLVVGDAFGGMSVPWHLTTMEAVGEIRRVLDADGVYLANLIDRGPLAFARAAVATIDQHFEHVVLLSNDAALAGRGGGNLVVVASDSPVDLAALTERMAERGPDWGHLSGAALRDWIGDAPILTDDYAPVDQLLTPHVR